MFSNSFAFYCSQPELQAINERGWLLTKAAEPATNKPKTTANARNFIIVQIESPWILDSISGSSAAEMRASGGTNTAFLSPFIGRGQEGRAVERLLQCGDHCDCRETLGQVTIVASAALFGDCHSARRADRAAPTTSDMVRQGLTEAIF